ncbi:hypothetical protein LXL04_006513 [Taraxacum kok-saghyz]
MDQNEARPTEDATIPNDIPQNKCKPKRKRMKQRSAGWDHFVKYTDKDGTTRARCKYCPDKSFACDSISNGTSNLLRHYKSCTMNPENAMTQTVLKLQSNNINGEGTLSCWRYDQDAIRTSLAHMLIIDELSFRFVEKEGFRYFMSVTCPKFQLPSRITIARDIYQVYVDEKKKLQKWFASTGQRVSLTTDTWTSLQRVNYMCLTAHFIDPDWNLHKKILNFCPILSHKGSQIGELIEKCLLDWGIDKLLAITVDNASSNDTAVAYMKKRLEQWGTDILKAKHLHMRCIAHIINLVVTDGLKEGSDSIDRVRASVKYIRNSPSRLAKFKSCIEFEKIQSKCSLTLDVCTRWNSTYLMLSSALKLRRAFVRFESEDPQFKFELQPVGVPDEEDWKKVDILVTFFKTFYDLTQRISGSRYVTSNTLFHEIIDVDSLLIKWAESTNNDFASMAKKMKVKYDKYWGDIGKTNMLIYVSVVLDPRHKLRYIDFVFSELHKQGDGTEIVMTKNVKDATYELFISYQKNGTTSKSNENTHRRSKDDVQEYVITDMKERYKKFKSLSGGVEEKSELEKYLTEENVADSLGFSILSWWKLNGSRFPVLSQMARDILAVPISTVASESTFSTGGRVLDSYRTSLSPKVVQALICTQDWIRKSHKSLTIEDETHENEELDEGLQNASYFCEMDPTKGISAVSQRHLCEMDIVLRNGLNSAKWVSVFAKMPFRAF